MKHKYNILLIMVVFSGIAFSFTSLNNRPTLYIIGDSTVRNGSGQGSDALWGWGSFMADHFDTTRVAIENHAMGGRSSRTFLTEGRWEKILMNLKKGDYVIMQFGHNDGGPLNDTLRARGTIPGTGTDSTQIHNLIRKVDETVHTYGWYMRKYVNDTKAKGATAIICSPIPRGDFDEKGKMKKDKYAAWGQEVAKQTGAYFIPLNDLVIADYEKKGPAVVKGYFPKDHTHTNKEGAQVNAQLVAGGIKKLKGCGLKKYLAKN
jgi:rhamnogalacturonan acetylesterase